MMSEIKLTTFDIQALDEQCYANGNQQCQVLVNVKKEQYNDATGLWETLPLTSSEIASVAVVRFSSDINETNMPDSWFCDTTRNEYDQGTFSMASLKAAARGAKAPAEPAHMNRVSLSSSTSESIQRYIRSSRVESQKLMARMQLDTGKVYTTNMSDGDDNFHSSIILTATTPLAIDVDQLQHRQETVQDQIYDDFNPDLHQKVTMDYWSLPAGLSILSGPSVDASFFYAWGFDDGNADNRILTRGRAFVTGSYSLNARDGVSGGCVQSKSYSVTVSEMAVEVLWISGCSWTSDYWQDEANFTMVDNFGNTHRYAARASGDYGSEVTLIAV